MKRVWYALVVTVFAVLTVVSSQALLSADGGESDGCIRPSCQNDEQCGPTCKCGPNGGASADLCYYR